MKARRRIFFSPPIQRRWMSSKTMASVESGNVEAGFVYKTDAAISQKVKTVFEVPIEKGPKITYPLAIVKESKKKEAARDFMNYVLGPAGKTAFKKYGFVVLD